MVHDDHDMVDIDECASSSTNDCDPSTGQCVDIEGDYECDCADGYGPLAGSDGHSCTGKKILVVLL